MPYDEIAELALREARNALNSFRGLYQDAKEASRRVDVMILETDTQASDIYAYDERVASGIIDVLAVYGAYTVHRTIEVNSATWSRVDIDEAGFGFDVVAHATSWKSRTDMLFRLLESAVIQLTNNVEKMEHSMETHQEKAS